MTKEEVQAVRELTGGCYALGSDDGRFANALQMYLRDIKPAHPVNAPRRVGALAFDKTIELKVSLMYFRELADKRRWSVKRRWKKRIARRAAKALGLQVGENPVLEEGQHDAERGQN